MTALEMPASTAKWVECDWCHEIVDATEWNPTHVLDGEPVMLLWDEHRAPLELHMSQGVYYFHRWHDGACAMTRKWENGLVLNIRRKNPIDMSAYLWELAQ